MEVDFLLKARILDKFSGPLKLPEMDPRAMENPISALFDLSDQVSDKAVHIRKNVWYSLLFVVLWVGVSFIFFLAVLANRAYIGVLIFFFILLSGMYTLRMLFFNYRFFDFFSRRYHAIALVRDGNLNFYVPSGDTPVDRFLNHLRENYHILHRLLTKHPESIQFSAILRGMSGGAYQFDAYIGIPGGSQLLKPTNLPTHLKKRGYALFIKVFASPPTLSEIKALEKTIQDITALTCLPPRVIALTEGGSGELLDEVYSYITERSSIAKCKKGDYPFNVQVASGVEGSYDYVPLISSKGLP